MTDSVDVAHAPIPANDSERLLFRQLYETLVWLDCEGNVRRGLAVSWSADSARRVWTFTLRDTSSSPAGTSEAAAEIVSSWQHRRAALQALGIEAVSPQAGGRLRVGLTDPLDSIPRLFADPALAVPHNSDAVPWPLDGAGVLRRDTPFRVDYRVDPNADPRDALDRDTDLLITRDPTMVEYAASKPGFVTFPLPWSRIYILAQPAGADPLLRSVTREAVRADARTAEPPYWWESRTAGCTRAAGRSSGVVSTRVVYPRGDLAARGLAERAVAVAGSGAGLRVAALEAAEFATSLASGLDRAYVMALPRQTLAPCRDAAGWPRGATIQPLIETRAHAIVRRGAPPLTVEWDGTVRVVPR